MLRGVVVGLGRMGLTHFSILNNHPEVQFVAVCDSSSFMLKSISKVMAGTKDIATYKDYEEMFRERKPDFAIIATPTAMHAEVAKCAVNHKIHVFVEKPLSLNPEQSRDMVDALKDANLVRQVGYVNRFNDVFVEIHKLIKENALGELLIYRMELNAPTLLKDAKSGWRSKKNEGGGCLCDFASHCIDLINYLVGSPDEILGTVFQAIYSVGIEDAISSTFLYDNGLRGNLLVNWSDPSYRKPAYRFEIMGRKGKIIADLHAYKAFFREEPCFDGHTKGWNQRYITDFVEPVRSYVRGFEFTRQLDYFIDCILNKKSFNKCSFEEGLETDIVIDRIRRNAKGCGE